ncbi:saccharopine dehydrogenase NADP-binding domain-containing protein [Hoyosella rhizosphaerae]|uniref:Saccharopine dehydrogenase n=1 Tax=Hoyosella rhizosphaerae TaxID=1755582 RepID=A0A916UBB3_9ACTN|nr:saccharopine dehydrogenase NADP-binding domain-containing protein [Hoyosella rhizosphaerae]MBN4925953.1 saccharopine dehydrogenase NADP-binding domain-containing protein [Hoyosella rhizosphaerae]GGC66662.1 saccharopine dehydrogenase [Hoyosella rhizosphaerae]
MTRRILVFGATGYTGGLVAQELLARGERPVLVARNAEALDTRARELDPRKPPKTLVMDVRDIGTLRRTINADDVIVTTVGPFGEHGRPVAEAAAEAGASYLDSAGEPPFIRWIFNKLGTRAAVRGARIMPGFGHEYVSGQLAGAWALERAAEMGVPHRLEIGYFRTEGSLCGLSRGTIASLAGASLQKSFTFRGGIRDERPGARSTRFRIDGRTHAGFSIGTTEHLTLPEISPSLNEVDVYLGWFGKASPLLSKASIAMPVISAVPGTQRAMAALGGKLGSLRSTQLDQPALAQSQSLVSARVFAKSGHQLSAVNLSGPNGYQLTASLLAWASVVEAHASSRSVHRRTGVLGAIQAYGLGVIRDTCQHFGLDDAQLSAANNADEPPVGDATRIDAYRSETVEDK